MTSTLTSVRRASQRTAANVHEDLKQGLDTLAAVATLAPFVGFLGTVLGIYDAFRHSSGEKTAVFIAIITGLSDSLWPAAWGLCIGITALVCHRYLSRRLDSLDLEMDLATDSLLDHLSQAGSLIQPSTSIDPRPMFGAQSSAELEHEQHFFHMCLRISAVASLSAWGLQTAYFRYLQGFTWNWSAIWATLIVLFLNTMACFPAYPIWRKFLHSQHGGLLATSSVIGLCLTAILIATRL